MTAKKPTYERLEQKVEELGKEAAKSKAAEKALSASEKKLSQIIDGTSIPTFVIDDKHVITHYNRAMENLTGISATEIIGTKNQWLAFYAAERPVMADLIVDGASEEEIIRLYGGKQRKSAVIDGAYEAEDFFPELGEGGKWLFFTAAPLRDSDGRITGAIETLQDISERKRAEVAHLKAETRYRSLLDFAPYAIVVFTVDGRVSYLNPAFTEIFGWTLAELEGQRIPYVPPELQQETTESIKRLFEEKIILRHETKRLTKDGRTLDVVMRATVFAEEEDEPAGELVILRDVTEQKRIARNSEAMLRVSMALPEYPDLEELLDYISKEIISLLGTEGAVVILLDEQRREIFFPGVAYDDSATKRRVKRVRLRMEQMDQVVAGKGTRLGEPVIVNDTSRVRKSYPIRDEKLGYETKSFLQMPLKSGDRIIGFLTAINKKDGIFDQTDVELLSMIASTAALSIENARFSDEVKRAFRNNQALLRISKALPEHPDLEALLDYISSEAKRLLDTEGALVILKDEESEELFFLGAAYDDRATQRRVKEIRFPQDELVAGKVIKRGEPVIVTDISEDLILHLERDKKLGYKTRNLLLVPLRSRDRIIGVLCAINKKEGVFAQTDVELLSMIASTVALSIENARFSEELKQAYREVSSLNRAKDKVINHLSHELKTPVSVLYGSLRILAKKMETLPEEAWKPTMRRAQRNLERILEIQHQTDDIMRHKQYKTHDLLSLVLDGCADELEVLVAEEVGEGSIVERVRERIEEIFGPREMVPESIALNDWVKERLEDLAELFSHRQVEIMSQVESTPPVFIPREALQKVFDGLVKNAVENTPDEGKIEVHLKKRGAGSELMVRDYGVGIAEEHQRRIFEGFFTTRETMDYSTMRPFDFNAGGKGADLLRMKIFSERYNFKIDMRSFRCRFIPKPSDICPGRISECDFCTEREDCYQSGGTTFSLYFPPSPGSE